MKFDNFRKLDDTLNEIDKYFKTCTPPSPGNLFMTYIAGMKVINVKMCSADSNFLKSKLQNCLKIFFNFKYFRIWPCLSMFA